MKPYYEDESAIIYHGDALELVPQLSFNVVVTDPPYGVAYVSNMAKDGPSKPIKGDGDTGLRDEVLKLCGDVPMLVFGSWRKPRPSDTRQILIWNKTRVGFMGDLSLCWGPCHEEIYVIGKGWTGKRRSNVYSVDGLPSSSKKRPKHPTPKPIPLMVELVQRCPEGTILDPFMGSGATLLAAKESGRKSIGIEIEEEYCELTANRLRGTTHEK